MTTAERHLRGGEPRGELQRLLHDTWDKRGLPATGRAVQAESIAAILFLAAAVPLALTGRGSQHVSVVLASALVVLFAVFSRAIRLPIGAGSYVPSYLALVPMLVLLPPAIAPLLAALGLVVGTTVQWAARRVRPEQILFAIPDAWHALGPALVLTLAGERAGTLASPLVLIGALVAACATDLLTSTLREWRTGTVAPSLQVRVNLAVWALDACVAPLGLLIAYAARRDARELLLLLLLAVVFLIANHDWRLRIADDRRATERAEDAAARARDALAASVDLGSLANVVLGAAVDSASADAGYIVLGGELEPVMTAGPLAAHLRAELDAASGAAWANAQPYHVESDRRFAFALPLSVMGRQDGVVAVARRGWPFSDAEREGLQAFVTHVEAAAADAAAVGERLGEPVTDALTGLGTRRKLAADLTARLTSSGTAPLVLALFDLDGLEDYRNRLGRPAADAMLTALASRVALSVSGVGAAYRLEGERFCTLSAAQSPAQLAAATEALSDRSTPFPIVPSLGSVLIPREATELDQALTIAHDRMQDHKHRRPSDVAPSRGRRFRVA